VPLSNFAPRGFGFVHHSIAILYDEVPNPNLPIRNFFIAVPRRLPAMRRRSFAAAADAAAAPAEDFELDKKLSTPEASVYYNGWRPPARWQVTRTLLQTS
jgi:hypothetical protein